MIVVLDEGPVPWLDLLVLKYDLIFLVVDWRLHRNSVSLCYIPGMLEYLICCLVSLEDDLIVVILEFLMDLASVM